MPAEPKWNCENALLQLRRREGGSELEKLQLESTQGSLHVQRLVEIQGSAAGPGAAGAQQCSTTEFVFGTFQVRVDGVETALVSPNLQFSQMCEHHTS